MAAPRSRASGRSSPLWLSHHWPEDLDRCTSIGGWQVCRRCAVIYPLAAIALVVVWLTSPPDAVAAWVLVLGPVPAVVELVGEKAGRWAYSPGRQIALNAPLGVALGIGFARYLEDQTDPLFWLVVVAYGGTGLAATLWAVRRARPQQEEGR